jgi:hypothetical protein
VENLAQIRFDRFDRRQVAPLGVEDEYRLFCRGWNGGKPADHKQQGAPDKDAEQN